MALFAAGVLACIGGRAQMAGGVSSDSETPREVKAQELQAQVLSGDVDLFTGRYSASYPLGEVATPGGLGFALALQYSPTIVGSTTPMLTEGVPYGAGWDVNVPTITVSNAYRHHYTEEQERNILEYGNVCPSYPCAGLATLDGMDEMTDGEGYWYAPMVNIPGVASGRAVFQRVDRSEAIFVLNTFEEYVELRYDGSRWQVLTPDGKVYVFGQAEVNVRMPSNQRALDYEEVNAYVGAADPDGLDAQLAQLKVRNSILPKEVTYSWHCITIADPLHLPGQFIRFEYKAYGEFDYYQELGQQNYNQWLYNELFSLGDDDSAYYYFGSPFLSLARASAARDVVLQRVLATTTEGEMARLELGYAAKNTGTQDLLNAGDSLDAMYGKELVWSQGGEEDFAEWVRFKHLKSDSIPWSAAPEAVSPHDPYVSAGGERYSVGLSAAADLPFDHGVLESPRIEERLFPGDIYEVRTQVYNASNAPTDIGNLDINVFTGTGPAIVGASGGTGWVSDNEYRASRERVLFSTFDRAVKWNTNGDDGNTQYTSNFFLMPDIPGGADAVHHGKAIKDYAGMTIQIGPANSDNDFSLGPKSG
ncbi:MAG: hypothetical protein JST66_09225, partial [Bacteroidetes bacterium]|nr:hypothetical protein [Bacteroidota bacterium]